MVENHRLQQIICRYYSEWLPYYEPLRALPLPQKPPPSVGKRRAGQVRCSETISRDCALEEIRIIHALDDARRIAETALLVKAAIETLSQRERDTLALLAQHSTSDHVFDFSAAAHSWTVGKRGMIAPLRGSLPDRIYTAWCNSKAEKRRSLVQAWERIAEKLEGLLGAALQK